MSEQAPKPDGGPAFPIPGCSLAIQGGNTNTGLTVRAYLAAAALQGMLASCANIDDYPQREGTAVIACEYADALIAELAK